MSDAHGEIDPIKSNPNSHKAIGVVMMLAVLVGLGYWLKGGRLSSYRALDCLPAAVPAAEQTQCCPFSSPEQPPQD